MTDLDRDSFAALQNLNASAYALGRLATLQERAAERARPESTEQKRALALATELRQAAKDRL